MIEPGQLSLHQNIAFLIKSDLAQHDVMQAMARQVAREFANADMVAASRPFISPDNVEALNHVRPGIDAKISAIESITLTHQLHYPLVLKRALQQFGLDEALFNREAAEQASEEIQQRQEGQNRSSDGASDEHHVGEELDDSENEDPTALGLLDIAVFRAVDQMLPELQNLGQCAGMQLSFYRSPSRINGVWKHRHIVLMLPIDGELGRAKAAFMFLLRRDFEPILIPGKLSSQPGNPIQPWPCQQLLSASQADLVMPARLRLEGMDIDGKSFLMGMITQMLSTEHWFEYDHRDISE